MRAKSLQSCLTLCKLKDCSPSGFSVHVILQARILVWVAMPSSRGFSPLRGPTHIFCVFLHWQPGALTLSHLEVPSWLCCVVVIVQWLSHVQLFATPWTAACQASLLLTIAQGLPKFMSIASWEKQEESPVFQRTILLLLSLSYRNYSGSSN